MRDELFTAGPGALAFAPGGVAHTLANLGDAPARYVLLCTPAGFEGYFGRLAAEAAGEDPPAWALAPTPPVTTVGGQIGERGDVAAATPIAPAGDHFNVVVHGEQNDGRVGVMLNRMPPGATGPPLHHHAFDEMFYVLEGELAFQVEDELVTKRSGELVFVPGGVAHAFTNRGDAPARFLIACTPAGFERHFARRAARGGGRRSACLGHAARTVGHEGRAAARRVTDEFRRAGAVIERTTPRAQEMEMAKIVVSQFVSLDGVFEDPGGSEGWDRGGWAFKYERGPEGDQFKLDEVMASDALLLGRVTYEGFAEAWPSRTGEFADKFNGMRKYVVSSSMDEPEWSNSVVVRPDELVDTVTRLRQEPGGDVLVNGSAQLVEALRANDLVDEYRLMVFPTVLGAGKRMFAGDGDASALRLMDAKPAGETLILVYEPVRDA